LDRKSLEETSSGEPPHPATDERALARVLQEPPVSGSPIPQVPEDFFCRHPVRRCLPVAPPSSSLVGHRPAMPLG
jgi:hypothetical protein